MIFCGPVAQRIERVFPERGDAGPNPAGAIHWILFHSAGSYQLPAELASGFRQRQGFVGPLSVWRDCSKKATVQIDLPFLPFRMSEVR
jgi:hypothetical protein